MNSSSRLFAVERPRIFTFWRNSCVAIGVQEEGEGGRGQLRLPVLSADDDCHGYDAHRLCACICAYIHTHARTHVRALAPNARRGYMNENANEPALARTRNEENKTSTMVMVVWCGHGIMGPRLTGIRCSYRSINSQTRHKLLTISDPVTKNICTYISTCDDSR